MISKKIPCDDISASAWYVLFNREGAKLILGSYGMEFCPTPHTNPEAIDFLTAKLTQHDQLRPEVLSKWRHWSLSAEPDAGLSDADWGQIAFDFLDQHHINLDRNQVMVVLHRDQSVDHLHIIWSRIAVDGSLARDVFRDCGISQKACRKIEKKYGLQELPSSVPDTKPGRSPPEQKPKKSRKAAEVRMNARGVKSKTQLFREELDVVWPRPGESLHWSEFVERLRASDIEVEVNRRGNSVGLSYLWKGEYRKASALGDRFKWSYLEGYIDRAVDRFDVCEINPIKTQEERHADENFINLEQVQPLPTPPSGATKSGPTKPTSIPNNNLLSLVSSAYENSIHLKHEQHRRKQESPGASYFKGQNRPSRRPRR